MREGQKGSSRNARALRKFSPRSRSARFSSPPPVSSLLYNRSESFVGIHTLLPTRNSLPQVVATSGGFLLPAHGVRAGRNVQGLPQAAPGWNPQCGTAAEPVVPSCLGRARHPEEMRSEEKRSEVPWPTFSGKPGGNVRTWLLSMEFAFGAHLVADEKKRVDSAVLCLKEGQGARVGRRPDKKSRKEPVQQLGRL